MESRWHVGRRLGPALAVALAVSPELAVVGARTTPDAQVAPPTRPTTSVATPAATPAATAAATPAATLFKEAQTAEAAYQIDRALDRLYLLQLEYPRSPEAISGRLDLARLLSLVGDVPAAMLQCQGVRDDAASSQTEREAALGCATLLARRLRAHGGSPLYGSGDMSPAKGLPSVDEPGALIDEPDGSLVLVDSGAGKMYRIARDGTASALGATMKDLVAAARLGDGTLIVGIKDALGSVPPGKPVPTTGTWGGKTRPLRRARSIAANSKGDLFIVDREYDGLLRCNTGAPACVPWGAPGKLRVVKTGSSDFVYAVDDKQQMVKVWDDSGKAVTTIGPLVGAAKFEKIADIAVDNAYAVYILDSDLRRVDIFGLRAATEGRVSAESIGAVTLPIDKDSFKNPTALTVSRAGQLTIAGKSTSLLRYK